ncbi:hypothetical protein [Shimia sediminis]|uniref:hypothetical protein n=1 Tax=Shimia sediminis TaxID=2497945 RepID=UPI000F8F35B3|nr:hypothetical protein [Shimia sediminis]
MNDDLFGKLDDVLAQKKREREKRDEENRIAKEKADARAEQNASLLKEVVLPTLKEIAPELEKRGIACVVSELTDTGAKLAFNPSGTMHHVDGQNANVAFRLGHRRSVSVSHSTMYNHGGGMSGSFGSISIDDDLATNIRTKVLETVLKTVG